MIMITRRKILFYLMCCTLSLFTVMPVFANETDEQMVKAYVPVSCVSENTTESFVYHLKACNTEYQTIASDTLTLKDGGNENFVITYTCPGTYSYLVYQDAGSDVNIVYDDTSYRVFVYVFIDETGELIADTVAYGGSLDEKVASLDFRNVKKQVESLDSDKQEWNNVETETDANKYGEDVLSERVQTSDVNMSSYLVVLLVTILFIMRSLRFCVTKKKNG